MNMVREMVATTLVVALASCSWAQEKKATLDVAKLLIGKWEVTKSEKEIPVGSVIEFSKDGAMKIAIKLKDGKLETAEATYKVVGDKLQFTLKGTDREKDPLTIKAVSEKELVLFAAEKNRTWEFKRVK